jgi:hypothetical protein
VVTRCVPILVGTLEPDWLVEIELVAATCSG